MENTALDVVEVDVPPDGRELTHTHCWPSVMLDDRDARTRYDDAGELSFESPEQPADESATRSPPRVEWMGLEGPHVVENVDTVLFHAIRVEPKG